MIDVLSLESFFLKDKLDLSEVLIFLGLGFSLYWSSDVLLGVFNLMGLLFIHIKSTVFRTIGESIAAFSTRENLISKSISRSTLGVLLRRHYVPDAAHDSESVSYTRRGHYMYFMPEKGHSATVLFSFYLRKIGGSKFILSFFFFVGSYFVHMDYMACSFIDKCLNMMVKESHVSKMLVQNSLDLCTKFGKTPEIQILVDRLLDKDKALDEAVDQMVRIRHSTFVRCLYDPKPLMAQARYLFNEITSLTGEIKRGLRLMVSEKEKAEKPFWFFGYWK